LCFAAETAATGVKGVKAVAEEIEVKRLFGGNSWAASNAAGPDKMLIPLLSALIAQDAAHGALPTLFAASDNRQPRPAVRCVRPDAD